jgi:epoxyqueuosine reductase QueG
MKRKYDERDTIFSRVKLEKGSKRYEEYYSRYPELKHGDDNIRGGSFRDGLKKSEYFKQLFTPLTSDDKSLIKALFDVSFNEPVNQNRISVPHSFSKNIKELTKLFGATDVGIVPLDEYSYYSHTGGLSSSIGIEHYGTKITPSYKTAIVFTVKMPMDLIRQAPDFEELLATDSVYTDIAYISSRLTIYLKRLGYKSFGNNSEYYLGPLVPLAYDAGLGEIGMTNHIVTKAHGNNVRLGAVFTTLEVEYDQKEDWGLQSFCKDCGLCLQNCPNQAISHKQRMVNGRPFYKFDDQACYSLWKNTGTDCGICIKSCPFSWDLDLDLVNQIKTSKDAREVVLQNHLKSHGRRPKRLKDVAITKIE